jgi:uncharacterized protein YecE (DUF72 family)
MEFGKVAASVLPTVDFRLPEDGYFTRHVLPGKRVDNPKVYIGAAKWGKTEWEGIIYPPGTKEKDFLEHYVNHFNCIELNATHYKIYSESTIKKWASKAQEKAFKFCPKVTQSISHYSDLGSLRAKELTDQFLQGVVAFGESLGPIFLQLSEKYSPQRKEQLLHYLEQLPKDLDFFLEVRHASWFDDAPIRKWLFGNLHRLGIGAVITDTSGRRDCVHMETTIPKTMIRFVGNGKHPTDFTRIDDWVKRLDYWISNGMEEVYFFMHQPHELYTPELSAYFTAAINKACGINLAGPQFFRTEPTLFD